MIPRNSKIDLVALALAKKEYPDLYESYTILRDQALQQRRELIRRTRAKAKALLLSTKK